MAENSLIGWTHHTLNFWMGCDKVAPECAKCYIDRVLKRQGREPFGQLYKTKTWKDAEKWQRWAEDNGNVYLRVFTLSLSDFFHVKADGWRADAWKIIQDTPNLIYLVLSKRPQLIARRLPSDWGENGYKNVWLGVSTGCRMTLNKMDMLRKIPAALRFVSMEPLLEDITACDYCTHTQSHWPQQQGFHLSRDGERPGVRCQAVNLDGFGWAITGGESGGGREYLWNPQADWRKEFSTGGRRTMKKEWAERLRDKVQDAGKPFYFKQKTAPLPGQGEDFLGRVHKDYPPPMPTGGTWAEKIAA
jgi:protein gp37